MISLTLIFIGITVLISIMAFNNDDWMRRLIMNPFLVVSRRQYYRTISSGFVHANWMHLGFNMFAFFFFGRVVESYFYRILGGSYVIVFIIFYITAIIVSDLPTIFKHRNNPNYNSLGASGAVSAIVFTSILYAPLNDIYIYFIRLPGFVFGLLYIIYSYWQSNAEGSGINHNAHLYGTIYGVVFGILVYPESAGGFIEQILQYKLF
ncbi:MAG: rhomboid family intramembrane serine protease [Bacteroidota bacterium]